ncbi:MAG: polysaccharide biosynthesis protein [Candidatus Magasanikbacteria bacterium]|nr:polysaccharide biosynthesis protein [Candidatus Magasanikbacteria bacterium]
MFANKRVLITGGTGSLGKVLVKRLLSLEGELPKKIIVFSRDEAKQHSMRVEYQKKTIVTDEIIYNNFKQLLEFRIGDLRDYYSVCSVLKDVDIVINAAALKQVPSCEYFPYEAVQTNITGAENIVRAIEINKFNVEVVVGVSTDKACKPVNVMGMTKAIQERVFISGNLKCPATRFICVRYGNVLASRGSVIPLFHEQIRNGGPVTVTTRDMTRFLLSLEDAVDTIFAAILHGKNGETYIPIVPAAKIVDVANVLIGKRNISVTVTGIRPGEKIHEILISDEEATRSLKRGSYFVIQPMLPELNIEPVSDPALAKEYSSSADIMSVEGLEDLLSKHNLLVDQSLIIEGEMLK